LVWFYSTCRQLIFRHNCYFLAEKLREKLIFFLSLPAAIFTWLCHPRINDSADSRLSFCSEGHFLGFVQTISFFYRQINFNGT
jgi:hypothetical protein